MSWVLTLLGFMVLIVLHELGHFIAAKAVGMRVERFSLFFPPKIWGVQRGETEYMIGAIPAGGYVKITGMNPNEEIPPEVAHRAYYRQPVWKRLVVIGAGPAMNVLVAFGILWGIYALSAQQPRTDQVRIAGVQQGHPAAAALRPGDVLVAVDGRRVNLNTSTGNANFITEISAHRCPGRQVEGCAAATPVHLTVLRDGRRLSFAITPRYDVKRGRMLVGIETAPVADLRIARAGRRHQRPRNVARHESHRLAHLGDLRQREGSQGSPLRRRRLRRSPAKRSTTAPRPRCTCWRWSRCRWRSSTSSRSCRSTAATSSGRSPRRSAGARSRSPSWNAQAS